MYHFSENFWSGWTLEQKLGRLKQKLGRGAWAT